MEANVKRIWEHLTTGNEMINFKGVSLLLGVNVNLSKQLLYSLHRGVKEAGGSCYAYYYCSGLMDTLSASARSVEESGRSWYNNLAASGHPSVHYVTICGEDELEELKASYSVIYSIHVYAVSTRKLESVAELGKLVSFSPESSVVKFGPFKQKELPEKPKADESEPPPTEKSEPPPADEGEQPLAEESEQDQELEKKPTFKIPKIPKKGKGKVSADVIAKNDARWAAMLQTAKKRKSTESKSGESEGKTGEGESKTGEGGGTGKKEKGAANLAFLL